MLAFSTLAILFLFFGFTLAEESYDVNQIHMAQGVTPESMVISWVTNSSTPKSTVRYGSTPKNLDNIAEGSSTNYEYYYEEYGNYRSGSIHHVYLNNLKPSTVYYYQCGDFSLEAASGVLMFKTLPKVGDKRPISFGLVGDLGQTSDSEKTVQHLLENNRLEMILHVGDLSYADCDQSRWDSYGEMIQTLSSERPWMVGPGNHEIEFNVDGSMFLAFEERYKMPAVKPVELGEITIPASIDSSGKPWCASSVFQAEYNYGNSFFSFEAASAHMIYLNPYSTSNETSVQYQWLEQDLKNIDRSVTPWVFVFMHCPWYNSNTGHHDETQTILMQASMEQLLYENNVNFVVTGHVHAYERTYPVYKNEVVDDGIMYITLGDGGNREGHYDSYYEQPPWSAYRNGTQFGHAEITLLSEEKMMYRWMRNIDGELVSQDELILCNTIFGPANC